MKKTLIKLGLMLGTVAASLAIAGTARAADFSFRGNFNQDSDVQLFNFSVGAASNVTLRTYSYAGGTQADGTTIAAGGFDPILALFDSAGTLITQNDDGGSGNVPADPVTGRFYDTFLQSTLAAGDYTVSVMQYDNFANGPTLAGGFVRDGQGNFTVSNCPAGASSFCDVTGSARTNEWAFDILNVSAALVVDPPTTPTAVPEPALLSGLVLFGIAGVRLRKAQSSQA